MDNILYLNISSTTLAHYLSRGLLLPSSAISNKPADTIQDTVPHALVLSERPGHPRSDVALEIVLSEEEAAHLIPLQSGYTLMSHPLPVTRIKKIFFADNDTRRVTIENIHISTAYVPDVPVSISDFTAMPDTLPSAPGISTQAMPASDLRIGLFDRIMGAIAMMRTVKYNDPKYIHSYNPHFIATVAECNRNIAHDALKIPAGAANSMAPYLFDTSDHAIATRRRMAQHIDAKAVEDMAVRKGDRLLRTITGRISNGPELSRWTAIMALLHTYGTQDEGRMRRIDELIASRWENAPVASSLRSEAAMWYGFNRGYAVFGKAYSMGRYNTVPVKLRFRSRLEYYIVESIYQYTFNNRRPSGNFPYLDSWIPSYTPARGLNNVRHYMLLDEYVIYQPQNTTVEHLMQKYARIIETSGIFAEFNNAIFRKVIETIAPDIDRLMSQKQQELDEANITIQRLKDRLRNNISSPLPLSPSCGNDSDIVERILKFTDMSRAGLTSLMDRHKLHYTQRMSKKDFILLLMAAGINPE